MINHSSNARVGIYVDLQNVAMNGGYGMRYDVLREFACRDAAEPVRLNAYVSFDAVRAKRDKQYEEKTRGFYDVLRDFGYKVIEKRVKWYTDESGNRVGKANADLDMAVDALLQSESLDRVLLITGDGDFVQVVRALQNKGCRVEVVAFDNVSADLRREADMFMSGYLIPNLLPANTSSKQLEWGTVGSRARGCCYTRPGDSYGFMRFLTEISPGLWITDARLSESPYETVFFHDSNLPRKVDPSRLPSRNLFFEFEVSKSSRGMEAIDIELVGALAEL